MAGPSAPSERARADGATRKAARPPCPGRLWGIERQGTPAEQTGLDFFRTVLPEDQARLDRPTQTLPEQLSGIKVYKVGDEAEREVYIVAPTRQGDRQAVLLSPRR